MYKNEGGSLDFFQKGTVEGGFLYVLFYSVTEVMPALIFVHYPIEVMRDGRLNRADINGRERPNQQQLIA